MIVNVSVMCVTGAVTDVMPMVLMCVSMHGVCAVVSNVGGVQGAARRGRTTELALTALSVTTEEGLNSREALLGHHASPPLAREVWTDHGRVKRSRAAGRRAGGEGSPTIWPFGPLSVGFLLEQGGAQNGKF